MSVLFDNTNIDSASVPVESTAVSYKFGNSIGSGAICFVDLTEDGISIQFYGEKEQTSIHVPAEELVDFCDWLNQRLGLPIYQINPDFKNTVYRIDHKIGGTYTYRQGDKTKLKKGLKALELAKSSE